MKGFLRLLLIGAAGLLVVCVVAALLIPRGGEGQPTPTAGQVAVATQPADSVGTESPGTPAATATAGEAQPAATPTLPWGTSREDVHALLAPGETAELVDGKDTYRITIEQIVDPAVSTNSFEQPKEGNRFWLVLLTVENASTQAHFVTSSNFQLRTVAGFDYDPTFAPIGFAEGEGLSQEIGPGGKARGIVVFELPEGEQPLFLKFDPSPVTSAELYFNAPNAREVGESGAAAPSQPAGAEGTPGDQAGKVWGTSRNDRHIPLAEGQSGAVMSGKQTYRFTVLKIVDGATSSNMFVQAKEGHKFWLVQLLFENQGTSAVTISSIDWMLRTRDGLDYEAEVLVSGFAEGEALTGEVGPGGKKQGVVVFEIPAEAQPLFLKFDPNPFTSGELYFDAE